ncbi:MAG: hypothetical protein R3B60_02665 [Candidatus Paceibacterota bacterium]
MQKEELFYELKEKLNSGEITSQEILTSLDLPTSNTQESSSHKSSFSVTKMLYILGSVVAVIGLVIFVVQIWDDLGSFGHIFVTLGLGLLFTGLGSMLLNQKPNDHIGPIFHFIGGVLIPSGSLVLLDEMNIDLTSVWPVVFAFGTIFIFYLLLNQYHKHAVLTFFAIANGTTFIYLLAEAILDGPFYKHDDFYAYLTMAVGASYLLLAHSFKDTWNKKLLVLLYFFGSTGLLGAAFTRVYDSGFWELFYFLLVFAVLYLSVYMKSTSILAVGTFFLIAHFTYITDQYFSDSLGWPISLVILGFIFIGLAYASVNINKKFINSPQ